MKQSMVSYFSFPVLMLSQLAAGSIFIFTKTMAVASTVSSNSARKWISAFSKMSNYSFLLLPKAVMCHPPTGRRGYHVCCCSGFAVHYFITKRGLITFCRIMLKLDKGNSFVVHMMFRSSEHLLSWIFFHTCSFFFCFVICTQMAY